MSPERERAAVGADTEAAARGGAAGRPAADGPSNAGRRGLHPALVLSLLVALAVGLRLFAWSRALMMMNDGVDFLWQAEQMLAGEWAAALSHPYHPLFALLTAAAALLVGDLQWAALAVSILGGVLTVLAAWALARRAFPDLRGAGAAAGLVAATNARLLLVSSDIQSDGPFAGLLLAGIWALLWSAETGARARRFALPGACAGLAYLVRPEGLFLFLPAGLLLLEVLWRPALLRQRLLAAGVFTASALVFVLPYVVALHALTDTWGLSLKPSFKFAGFSETEVMYPLPAGCPLSWGFIPRSPDWRAANSPRLRQADAGDVPAARAGGAGGKLQKGALFPLLLSWAQDEPEPGVEPLQRGLDGGRALVETLWQLVNTARLEFLLLAIPGVVLLARRRRGLCLALAVTVAGWLAVVLVQLMVVGYTTNRHMLAAVVLLLPVGGAGLAWLWARGWVLRVLVVLAILEAAEAGSRPRRADNGPRLAALAWVTEHTSPEQAFLTQRRRDGYYAGRAAIPTGVPVDTGALAARLARQDIPFVVYDLHKLKALQPDWLDGSAMLEVARFGPDADGMGDTVVVLTPRRP